MSGSIAFTYFPSQQWRPSGVNVEFSASQANTAIQDQRTLIIGQMLTGAPGPANVAVQAPSLAVVNAVCGVNSMISLKYQAYRKQDPFGDVWIAPLADAAGGVAATATMGFTGPATTSGTLALYIMGVSIPVAILSGDASTVIASNVRAAINLASVPCTAAVTASTVTLTADHKGLALNDMDIRLNYLGPQNGEVTPPGVSVAITQFSGGTVNPDMAAMLANLGARLFDFIDLPYTDTASLNALQAFLSDQSGRWSAINMLYGHVFTAFNGTISARATFGNTRNDQHASTLGYPGGVSGSPTPAWLEASDWCGAHILRIKTNPAQGVTGQRLNLLPPPTALVDTPGERNTLLFDGISTFTVDPSGTCRIDRSITTYQTNPSGQPDNSYLGTNLLFQAMFAARYINIQLTTQYIDAGKILLENGTPIGPGSPGTTPDGILGAAIALYGYLVSVLVCQDVATFARNARAEKGTKGQVLLYLPINFSDQVINIAALVQFQQTT